MSSLLNDLRIRVLEGDEPSAEEMLMIVNDIRRERRAAARPAAEDKPKRRTAAAKTATVSSEDLRSLLDQGMP